MAVARGIGAEKSGFDEAADGLSDVVDAIALSRRDIPRIIAEANRVAQDRADAMRRSMAG